MTGKSHIAMNVATAITLVDTSFLISHTDAPIWLKTTEENIRSFVLDNGSMPQWMFLTIGITLFMLGALLPDIDHKDSTLGKKGFYIPVGHRTWTHAIWMALIFFVIGVFSSRLFVWLVVGTFFHFYWDSFSASGTYWFYPIKWKHPIKLYHTSEMSEYVFLTIHCTLTVIYTIVCFQCVYHFVDVTWKV